MGPLETQAPGQPTGVTTTQTPFDFMNAKKGTPFRTKQPAIQPLGGMPGSAPPQPSAGQPFNPMEHGFDRTLIGMPQVHPAAHAQTPGQAAVGSQPSFADSIMDAGNRGISAIGPHILSGMKSLGTWMYPSGPVSAAPAQQTAQQPEMAQLPQVQAENAAMAPHAGGDGVAVTRPDVQPGSGIGQPPPNPMQGSAQSPGTTIYRGGQAPQRVLSGNPSSGPVIYRGGQAPQMMSSERAPYQGVAPRSMEEILTEQAAFQARQGNNTSDQLGSALNNLFGLQHQNAAMTTAKAHEAAAHPLDQNKTPFGIRVLANEKGMTPYQVGGLFHAAGLGAPGGQENQGYYAAMEPALQQQPGAEPRSAEDMLKLMDTLRSKHQQNVLRAMLDSFHAREDYRGSGQPGAINNFAKSLGMPGGYNQALENRRLYQQFYGG